MSAEAKEEESWWRVMVKKIRVFSLYNRAVYLQIDSYSSEQSHYNLPLFHVCHSFNRFAEKQNRGSLDCVYCQPKISFGPKGWL